MKRYFLDGEIKKRNLTYAAVGKEVNVSRQMISYIVNGKYNPGYQLQQRLVKFFNIPAEKLLAITET